MAYPIQFPFKTRTYSVATTTTSGTPSASVVVVSRSRYIGGYFAPSNSGTSTNVTGFDVFAFKGGETTAVTISSGTSVTTTTGTLATAIRVTASTVINLDPGDIIVTVGSTCQAGYVTHIVREF